MHIVSYVHAYVPVHNGGAETTIHDLNLALLGGGHDVTVIVKRKNNHRTAQNYVFEGVKVIHEEDKRTALHYLPRADLIMTHLECSPRASVLGGKYGVPVANLVHNDLHLTRNYVAQGTDLVVYNTEWIRERFAEEFGHLPNIVVHPPVISERYKTDRGKSVTLVNLFERKGAHVFYALAERFPNVSFLGVKGGYGEQMLRHDLPNVEIMEHDFDMKKVFEKTKIILMPSHYESYGRVACEALASGIPAIVADTTGPREALGDSGTYVDPTDVNAWETALRASLTPRKYGALSKGALARSNVLDTMARNELETFVLYCEQFVSLFKKKR